MRKHETGYTADLLTGRTAILELIVAGVILALSIHIIAATSLEIIVISPGWKMIAGVLLGVISFLLLIRRLVQSAGRRDAIFHGFIIYLRKDNAVANIPRYRYGSDLYTYLCAAFTENLALKMLWGKEPLSNAFFLDKEAEPLTRTSLHSVQLIKEATEYFVLSRLSTHLTDYFNDDEFEKDHLKEYAREDVPDILLKNRFMDLFSRPMDQRAAFVDRSMTPSPQGNVIVACSHGGALYEKFDLVLPLDSSVDRGPNGAIRIETPKLVLSLQVEFKGMCTVLPRGFEEYYIGLKDFGSYTEYEIALHAQVAFKWRSYLSGAGWEYHKWVDSFIESIEESFDEERFFHQLNWPTVLTFIEIFRKNQFDEGSDRTDEPSSG